MSGICHIVGAADFSPLLFSPEKGDLVIAADGGFLHLNQIGFIPDLFIGDGDSLGFFPEGIERVVLPEEKDDTDLVAAARIGLARGYRRFFFHGALGGDRFSHSIANLQLLSFLEKEGAEGTLAGKSLTVKLLSKGDFYFDFSGGFFSLFSLEGGAVVSVSGAKYPLEEKLLVPFFPLGVSNEGTKNTKISVHSGKVLLIREF
jgi:thiamine pyrophosphokinase